MPETAQEPSHGRTLCRRQQKHFIEKSFPARIDIKPGVQRTRKDIGDNRNTVVEAVRHRAQIPESRLELIIGIVDSRPAVAKQRRLS